MMVEVPNILLLLNSPRWYYNTSNTSDDVMLLWWQDIGPQQKNQSDRGRHLAIRIHPGSHKQADRLDFLKVSELIL